MRHHRVITPRYLALETSSPRLSLALGDDERLCAAWSSQETWRHAESLMTGLDTLLARQNWRIDTLTGVAVSVGPGSFTGIRIGLAAARALAQFLRIPLVGVNALEALAHAHAGRVLSPAIDALRGQVFCGFYRRSSAGDLARLRTEACWPRDRWVAECRRRAVRGGFAVIETTPEHGPFPRAENILALARPRFFRARPTAYESVRPFYLRDPAPVERRRRG